MSSTHYLVVGANRGIGYALVERILEMSSSNRVVATYRDPSKLDALTGLIPKYTKERLLLTQLDMSDTDSCLTAAKDVSETLKYLDVVIVNAGISIPKESLIKQDLNNVIKTLDTNLLGPLRVCQAFVPLLIAQSGLSKLVLISSEAGSITKHRDERNPAYAISKAALNMAGRKLSADHELLSNQVAVALVHPGWVKTDMGGLEDQEGKITPEESAAGILRIVSENLKMSESGKFWNIDGNTHEW